MKRALILFFIVGVFLSIGCGKKDAQEPMKKVEKVTIKETVQAPQETIISSVELPSTSKSNEQIILSGRWFFSAQNIKGRYTDYYDKYGNYLGRQVAKK